MNWNDGSEDYNKIHRLNEQRRASLRALQISVLAVLDRWEFYTWSVQGFGLLRLYVKRVGRLHLWNLDLRYPGVSMIHNHSWDLRSTVVSGEIMNTKFNEFPEGRRFVRAFDAGQYHKHRLVTGFNCEIVTPQSTVNLHAYPATIYRSGDTYTQAASEIHRTDALDGSITLMERTEDVNGQADVYWPAGSEWGTAKPRPATRDEVHAAISKALRFLEKEIG